MEPGTYEITPDNFADIIDPVGSGGSRFFHFSGEHSYWDLRGVKINTETRVLGQITEALPNGHNAIEEVRLAASDSILRGLDYENVPSENFNIEESPLRGSTAFHIDGVRNLIHDVTITSRGSYPYGYSSILGKGGGGPVELIKKSCIAGGGYKNLHVGMVARPRSFGHALGFVDLRNLEFIDCVIDGEDPRNTNEIYEETSGPAYENDFKNKAGNPISKGVMISYHEGAFRTYGDFAQAKLLNVEVSGTRPGTGFGAAPEGDGVHIAGSTFRDCTRRGVEAPPESTIVNCAADFKYGPALRIGHWGGPQYDIDAEVTLLPSETDDDVKRQAYAASETTDGYPWPWIAAGVTGTNNRAEIKAAADDLGKPEAPIVVGQYKLADGMPAKNCTVVNRTAQPVVLRESSQNCTVKSKGPVRDRGSNNDVQSL
jgi:hypothetical protein